MTGAGVSHWHTGQFSSSSLRGSLHTCHGRWTETASQPRFLACLDNDLFHFVNPLGDLVFTILVF